jgi:prepilin-type N-terminal cleavage/methylation domain-containing protein
MKSNRLRKFKPAGAFTLTELMVVVVIMCIVAGVIVGCPYFRKPKANRTAAWISSLAAGCENYKSQYGFYPGQDPYWSSQLDKKAYTGSQVLFVTLVGPNDEAIAGNVMPSSFAEPNGHYWDTVGKVDANETPPGPTDTKNTNTISTTVADKFPNRMPMLYYPARLGGTGLSQFVMSDNSAYSNGSNDPKSTLTNQANFNTYITDPAEPKGTPFRAGGFILVSAGVDRVYGLDNTGTWTNNPADHFKCDDIRSYSDSRN